MSRRRLAITALVLTASVAAGCAKEAAGVDTAEPPAVLLEADDGGTPTITLTERAEQRLGIAMDRVVGEPGALVVTYDAVIYEHDGTAWVYTSPEPQTYRRTAIEVNWIENGLVLLDEGPPVGTEVVDVGAAELHGVEAGL